MSEELQQLSPLLYPLVQELSMSKKNAKDPTHSLLEDDAQMQEGSFQILYNHKPQTQRKCSGIPFIEEPTLLNQSARASQK